MKRFLAAVSVAGAFVTSAAAAGPAFLQGEVLVGGRPAYAIEGLNAYIQAYSGSGIYQRDAAQLWGGHPRDALMLGGDVLFSDAAGLVRLHPDGSLSLFAVLSYYEAGLAIDSQGDLLVGSVGGAAEPGGPVPIVKLNPAGQQVDSYLVASDDRAGIGVSGMDLAADQCTLYYATVGRHVKRYDICQGKALSNLVDFGSGVFVSKVRVLSDGSVLAAATSGIVRISSSGASLQVYGGGQGDSWCSLSVDTGGTSFWAGSIGVLGARIEKFDVNSGDVVAGPIPTLLPAPFPADFRLPPEFVLVAGERRAAEAAVTDPAQIPSLSSFLEIVLILMLAGIALVRLR